VDLYSQRRTTIDMDAVLQLAPLIRPWVKHANGTFQSEKRFLDFVVDGQSLWELLGKERHDMVCVLCVE